MPSHACQTRRILVAYLRNWRNILLLHIPYHYFPWHHGTIPRHDHFLSADSGMCRKGCERVDMVEGYEKRADIRLSVSFDYIVGHGHPIGIISNPIGCKPPLERPDITGVSASPSPWSSYQPSPHMSYNPSPSSSSFPSSSSSSYIAQANNFGSGADGSSPNPWAKNLSAPSSKFSQLHHLFLNGGSISAPVTPPLSSPTASTPHIGADWDVLGTMPPWASAYFTSLPNSTPQSPGHQVGPDPAWLAAMQISSAGPSSPTRNLVSSNPFGPCKEVMTGRESSRMCPPGQSGTCSLIIAGSSAHTDIHMSGGVPDEFAFGSSSNGNNHWTGLVKAWEGERIHEESGSDDLELTLGRSRNRADA